MQNSHEMHEDLIIFIRLYVFHQQISFIFSESWWKPEKIVQKYQPMDCLQTPVSLEELIGSGESKMVGNKLKIFEI